MTYKLTLAVVLFCTSFCFAQNSDSKKLDSLVKWLDTYHKIPDDSTQIGSNSRKAIQLSKATNNQKTLATSYHYLALYHREYSKLDSAVFYLNKVKDIHSDLKDDNALANNHLRLKEVYALKADYDIAMEHTYKALELFEKTKNQKGIAQCYSHIGHLLYFESRYSNGAEYCDKAIAIQEKLNAKEDLALSYYHKGFNESLGF